jgi:hypothetical protein
VRWRSLTRSAARDCEMYGCTASSTSPGPGCGPLTSRLAVRAGAPHWAVA